jgi:hypothetical protein
MKLSHAGASRGEFQKVARKPGFAPSRILRSMSDFATLKVNPITIIDRISRHQALADNPTDDDTRR